jgi:hypothetical protein
MLYTYNTTNKTWNCNAGGKAILISDADQIIALNNAVLAIVNTVLGALTAIAGSTAAVPVVKALPPISSATLTGDFPNGAFVGTGNIGIKTTTFTGSISGQVPYVAPGS